MKEDNLGPYKAVFYPHGSISSAFGIIHYLNQKGKQKPQFCFPWKQHMWSIFIDLLGKVQSWVIFDEKRILAQLRQNKTHEHRNLSNISPSFIQSLTLISKLSLFYCKHVVLKVLHWSKLISMWVYFILSTSKIYEHKMPTETTKI